MKKSIAFLGALLFGSVTFGQVTKNDSIKKPSSRKVSSEDLKKFPEDAETVSNPDYMKLESTQKHIKYTRTEKNTSETSAKNGEIALEKVPSKGQKNTNSKPTTTEKQHYTVKLTNANNKADTNGNESGVIKEGATTQKKHVSNFKWSGLKKVKDSLPSPTSSEIYMKIGDIKGEKVTQDATESKANALNQSYLEKKLQK
jgi:hypothetical protein